MSFVHYFVLHSVSCRCTMEPQLASGLEWSSCHCKHRKNDLRQLMYSTAMIQEVLMANGIVTCCMYTCHAYTAGNLNLGGPGPIGGRKANLSPEMEPYLQEIALSEQVNGFVMPCVTLFGDVLHWSVCRDLSCNTPMATCCSSQCGKHVSMVCFISIGSVAVSNCPAMLQLLLQ